MSRDPFDLARFVAAQAPVHGAALRELKAGRKRTHWMWFVFPQLAGLGRSETAHFFAITCLEEAAAYAEHPLLGARLREATRAALSSGVALEPLFGSPDDLKFRSCMTLFAHVAPAEPLFGEALDRLCAGERDPATLALIARQDDI